MTFYYNANSLKSNTSKSNICAFHLHIRVAKRQLHVEWQGSILKHTNQPKYLCIILDRSRVYKNHCQKTRQNVWARNHLLKKLTGSKWVAHPRVLQTTADAQCFFTGEYVCPAWINRSAYARKVALALNQTYRLIMRCKKAHPLEIIHNATSFAAPFTCGMAIEYTKNKKNI